MIIKDILIKEYPLTKKIELPFECYEVIKRRYVVFYDEKINRDNIESLLDIFNENAKNILSEKKTLIVVGYTNEQFNKKDLLYFNGVDTFVVFYLINDDKEIFFNNQRVFWFGLDWKKIIMKFNAILDNSKLLLQQEKK